MENIDIEGKYRIALLIDNEVCQIIYADAADAAKFLSQPSFAEIAESAEVSEGFIFNGTDFVNPSLES